jgi:hypothetical protein
VFTVRSIPESDERTPDLEGVFDCGRVLCEIKTMGVSDDEIRARRGPPAARQVSNHLSEGFFHKLESDITHAKRQLQSYDPDSDAQHLVYIKICSDDWPGFYKQDYLREINQHLLNQRPGIKVVVSAGFSKKAIRVVA